MKPGKDIIIISIDGVKGAFEAMIAGKLNVTVECSPLLGPQLMQAVKDVVAGKTLPEAHRHRGRRVPDGNGGARNSRTASTERRDATAARRARPCCERARHRASASRGVRALRRRRLAPARRRSPRADGAERRRQVDADQGADRRRSAPTPARSRSTAQPIAPASPLEAQRLGISTVYQEVNLCPNLSVAENIFAGRYPRRAGRGGGIDWRAHAAQTRARCSRACDLDDRRRRALLGSYPVAVQQMVAIARALSVVGARADPRRADLEPRRRRGRAAVRGDAAAARRRAWRSCSSPTSSTRCTRSPTASRCCATARCGRIPGGASCRAGADRGDGRPRAGARRREPARPRRAASSSAAAPLLRARGLGRRGASAAVDLDVRAGRDRWASPACSARAAPSSRACCSGSTAPTAASCASTASRARCAIPREAIAPRPGVLPGRAQDRGHRRRAVGAREHRAGAAGARAACWRLLAPREQQRARRALHRAARHQGRRLDTPIGAAVRRQPAEGAARALAGHRAAAADPRRADARHRRRRQAGDHGRDRWRSRAQGMAVLFISSEIDEVLRVSRPHRRAARPPQGRRAAGRQRASRQVLSS